MRVSNWRTKSVTILLLAFLFFNLFLTMNRSFIMVNANDTNLAVIPYDWGNYELFGDCYYSSVYPASQPQITYYDESVERTVGAGSIKIGAYQTGSENTAREVDAISLGINPGDRIVFGMWMKTTESEFDDTGFCGARIGIDFYGSGGRITGLQSDGAHGIYPNEQSSAIQAHYVPWDSDWTYREIDFTVPATIQSDSTGQQVVPTAIIPWSQIWSSTYGNTDDGEAWFADATLYINPTEEEEEPTYLFSDDFESGDLSAWTGNTTSGTTISITDTEAYNGTYSAVVSGLNSGFEYGIISKTLDDDTQEAYMRSMVLFNDSVSTANTLVLAGPAFHSVDDVYILQTGYMKNVTGYYWVCRVDVGGGEVNYYSNVTTIDADQWYCLEIRLLYSTENAGVVQFWVDEELVVERTGLNFIVAPIRYARCTAFIWDAEDPALTVLFDSVIVSDSYIGMISEDTYSLSLTISEPANITYTENTINYNVSTYGNDTNPSYQINAYHDGSPVGANQTSSTGSFSGLSNGTYIFACYAIGEENATDYKTVTFTVLFTEPTPTPSPSPTPTPIPEYGITVISSYGSPTANTTAIAGSDYVTSVVSPYSGTTGTRYVCSGYSIDNAGAGVQYTGVTYTFTNIQTNHTIWYYWTTQYYLTVTSTYGSPTGQGWYNSGANATFAVASTVSGASGTRYTFNSWAGTGTGSYTGTTNSSTVTMNAPITETASWTTQYYLTVSSLYGVTSGSGWYNSTTTAYAGLDNSTQISGDITYTFSGWSTGGSNYTQSDPITMTSAITVIAYWIPGVNQYVIYSSAGSGGSILPYGATVVNEGGSQTFTITASTGYRVAQVIVDGVDAGALSTYTFSNVTNSHIIQATFVSTVTTERTQTLKLYMRSDTYTFYESEGYGLDTDYTNTYINLPTDAAGSNITYGFRIYKVDTNGAKTELTSGEPDAKIFLSGNYTGTTSSSWVCPTTSLTLGYNALEINVYVSLDSGVTWTNLAVFLTHQIMGKQFENTLWTIALNVNATITDDVVSCGFLFGDSTYRSTVEGVTLLLPKESDLQKYRIDMGDLIGFVFGAYFDILGDVFYVLVLFAVCGSLYRRYGHAGIVLVFFIIFAGTGGIIFRFLPLWAMPVAFILLILACASLLWRVIR